MTKIIIVEANSNSSPSMQPWFFDLKQKIEIEEYLESKGVELDSVASIDWENENLEYLLQNILNRESSDSDIEYLVRRI